MIKKGAAIIVIVAFVIVSASITGCTSKSVDIEVQRIANNSVKVKATSHGTDFDWKTIKFYQNGVQVEPIAITDNSGKRVTPIWQAKDVNFQYYYDFAEYPDTLTYIVNNATKTVTING